MGNHNLRGKQRNGELGAQKGGGLKSVLISGRVGEGGLKRKMEAKGTKPRGKFREILMKGRVWKKPSKSFLGRVGKKSLTSPHLFIPRLGRNPAEKGPNISVQKKEKKEIEKAKLRRGRSGLRENLRSGGKNQDRRETIDGGGKP